MLRPSSRLTLALVVALVASAPVGTSLGTLSLLSSPTAGDLLVGFDGPIDTTLLATLGAQLLRSWSEIGVAHVHTSDIDLLSGLLRLAPNVAFVETDDALRLAASSWDASSWDASSWDASSWDASSWDASSWDASSWDASSWDASSWDASSWDASSWDASSWDSEDMDAGYATQWGLGAANFPDAWVHTTGSGQRIVCVLDTGVDATHPDLRANLWRSPAGDYGHNAMRRGTSAADDVGHGTHVAGIIAALSGNGIGVTGAADAQVLAIKVMDAQGGTESDLASGLMACASRGASVASLSLHIDAASPTVARAITHLASKDILVIASTGNAGAAHASYPAAYPNVLAVGALTPSGAAAGFSNKGADIMAPGYRIASTFPGGYAIGSGTSQAAPFVAAAAVLVRDAAPWLDAAATRDALLTSARDLGAAGPDATYGHGALNAGAAVLSVA